MSERSLNKNKFQQYYQHNLVQWIAETGLLIAVFIICNLAAISWSRALFPNGGTIGFDFVIVVTAFLRRGTWSAIMTMFLGTIFGYLLTGNLFIVNGWQFLLDYTLIPWVGIPLGALAAWPIRSQLLKIIVFIGVLAVVSFTCHLLSGSLFFANNAPIGQSAWIYSAIYNSSYEFPSYLISMVICCVGYPKLKHLYNR